MTPRRTTFRRLLALEAAGFLIVSVIIWLDELLDLPHRVFGAPPTPVRIAEGTLESVLTLALGAVVVVVTARAFRRILYLESLVVLCAWCRRVRDGDEWLTVEEFLERQHAAETTHGICERCAATVMLPPST